MHAASLPDVGTDMVRPDLEGLPDFELPRSYSIRAWRPGDMETWTRLQRAAEKQIEITDGLFREQFGGDDAAIAARQLFLCDAGGRAVGTGTAWFDEERFGERWGQVHWMAVVPGQQGRGLGRTLLAAVCRRLREAGHRRAFLITSTGRLPAIRLYLRFGFRPAPRDEAGREAWRALARHLAASGVEHESLAEYREEP